MTYVYNSNTNNPQISPVQQSHRWGQPAPPLYPNEQPNYPAAAAAAAATGPSPTIDATALSPQMQPVYNSPQFAPPPPAPKNPSGSVLKALNFFSTKPSYQVNTGESSLSGPVSPPLSAGVYSNSPQKYGVVNTPPPMSAYSPAHAVASASPMPAYSPVAPVGLALGYQPSPVVGQAPFQQQQPHHHQQQQQQHEQPQYQQQQQHEQPQYQQHQQQYQQQQQQTQHQQSQPQPQPQYHQNQNQNQNQQHQQPQTHENAHPATAAVPPPAYTQGQNGGQQWPEKPTIQSNQFASAWPEKPPVQSNQTASAWPEKPPVQSNHTASAWPEKPPVQSNQTAAPVPAPAAPTHNTPQAPNPGKTYPQTLPPGNLKYWTTLIEQGKIPLAPKPQLRGLFRGIAACINQECALDASPECVLSPAKMAMYYGIQSGYDSRESQLFSRAQTAPSTLLALYTHLEVEHLLIPSNPGDGRRKPHVPALTLTGFEHWLLINALLDPEAEYARLSKFISKPTRQIPDDHGGVFPSTGFPRKALPAAPDQFVLRRYGGHLEAALASSGKTNEMADEEGWKRQIEELKKRLFDTRSELDQRDSELQQKSGQLGTKGAEVEQLHAELDRRTSQLDTKSAELDRISAELDRKNAEVARKDSELEALRRQVGPAPDEGIKMSASWGIATQDQHRPNPPFSPPPLSPLSTERRQSELVWGQGQGQGQGQSIYQGYPGQGHEQEQPQRRQTEQQWGQQQQQPQQQQTYYRQQYKPVR